MLSLESVCLLLERLGENGEEIRRVWRGAIYQDECVLTLLEDICYSQKVKYKISNCFFNY